MTILVTGASGFIGSWLTRALIDDGETVIAQMRREPSGLFARLNPASSRFLDVAVDPDPAAVVERYQPRTIFHLAGMSQIGEAASKPSLAYEANTRLTWLVLEAVRKLPVCPLVVVASSDSIYGETGEIAATEDQPLKALGAYEISKTMADITARAYAAQFGLPVAVARLGNVYGTGDANGARIIPSLLRAVRTGSAPQLRGGGRAVRSLLHVDDCVTALRLLAVHAADPRVSGHAFNVSGDNPMTTYEIFGQALDLLGRNDIRPEISDEAPGETSIKISSSAKLRAILGWSPTINLAQGLSRLRDQLEPI